MKSQLSARELAMRLLGLPESDQHLPIRLGEWLAVSDIVIEGHLENDTEVRFVRLEVN